MVDKYGAGFKVFILYNSTLKELCEVLSESLELKEFWFDNFEDEPYHEVAYLETLGFELSLKEKNKLKDDFIYVLESNTLDSFKEIHEKRMYDLSRYMCEFISLTTKLKTCIEYDCNNQEWFYYDQGTQKVKSSKEFY